MKYTQSELEARLAEVRRSYLVSLRDKSEMLTTLWTELCQKWNEDCYRDLYMILHGLAGSAETLGLAEVSADARVLVQQLKPLAESPADANKVLPGMVKDYACLMSSLTVALNQLEDS